MSSVEAQRLSFARDLHDTVLQEFLVILMQVRRLEESGVGIETAGRVHHALAAATRGIDCVRQLLIDLRSATTSDVRARPAASLSEDLAATLDAVVGHSSLRSTLRCPAALFLPPPMQREVVQIVREAATNAVRHADARRITCQVVAHRGALQVAVSDDGHGFLASDRDGFGLTGMRERAALIGASIHVASNRLRGTTVALTLPIDGTLASRPTTAGRQQARAGFASPLREGIVDDRLVLC